MISIEDEFDTLKMVLLLEQEPLTDKFTQVMLTQEQYKALTGFLVSIRLDVPHDGEKTPCDDPSCLRFVTSDRYNNIHIENIPYAYTPNDLTNPLK